MSGDTFGRPWGIQPAFVVDGKVISMYRRGQRVRFFDELGNQIGPEHANVAPAVVWGYAQGWTSPDTPEWLQRGIRRDIAAGLARQKARTAP